jgi:hypothetical protein
MRMTELKRYSHWLPATVVAAVVVVAGARLITLSVHERAAQMRVAAQSAVVRYARLIDAQLQALTDRTRGEAQRAANVLGDGTRPVAPASAVPDRNTFWMTAKGVVLRAGESDAVRPGPLRQSVVRRGAGAHRVTVGARFRGRWRAVGGLRSSGRVAGTGAFRTTRE